MAICSSESLSDFLNIFAVEKKGSLVELLNLMDCLCLLRVLTLVGV